MTYLHDRSTSVLERYRSILEAQDKEVPVDVVFEISVRYLDR